MIEIAEASAARLAALEARSEDLAGRLADLESKLDRVLAVLEPSTPPRGKKAG